MKKQRLRIEFSKTYQMRYTSHLDLVLTWERTFRRSGLPLAYSEGYNPRPVMNLASPLPLGYTSTGEIGDFWLSEIFTIDHISHSLDPSLPPGIRINEVKDIEDLHGLKLPALVTSAVYEIKLRSHFHGLAKKIAAINNASTLMRSRKKKEYDLRPLIIDLSLMTRTSDQDIIQTTLTHLPGATGRPDEVLAALEIPLDQARILRTKINLRPTGEV